MTAPATFQRWERLSALLLQQQLAIGALTAAAEAWRAYTGQVSSQYRNPVWTNRVGIVDWARLGAEVEADIAIARQPAKQ